MEQNKSSDINISKILKNYWPIIAAGILFIIIQLPILENWWEIWMEDESYYSHGPLVPLIAIFMAWSNRGRLAKLKPSQSWLGLVFLLGAVPIHCIAMLMEMRFLYGIAFLMLIFGISFLMLGVKPTLTLSIPILFLVTMMPIMSWLLDKWTANLQLISASLSTKFLQVTATPDAIQSGNYIHSPSFPNGSLLVGVPCSGLKLLISLLTFSWFFIYIINGTFLKKTALFIFSLPLSIFINALRITMIGYVGIWTKSSDTMNAFHDWSGYIGLVICFFILFGVAKLIGMRNFKSWEIDPEDAKLNNWNTTVGLTKAGAFTIVILVLIAAINPSLNSIYNFPKGKLDRQSIPYTFNDWHSEQSPVGEKTAKILEKGDLLSLNYFNSNYDLNPVNVFLDASLDVSAFHDPHYCLPGGGSPITEDNIIKIKIDKPKPMTIEATFLTLSANYMEYIVIYWYMLGDESFPSTDKMVDKNRQNKKDDLYSLVTKPTQINHLRENTLKRQFVWYRFSTDLVTDNDKDFLIDFIKDYIANMDNFGSEIK